MAVLAVIKPGATTTNMGAGTACTAGGDSCPNDGKTLLRFTNTSGSDITVTVAIQATSGFGWITYSSKAVIVPLTSGDVVIGPFPINLFNDFSSSLVLTYTAVTNLKVWPISAGGS